MSDIRNVIIIGSGPAGFTAALYTARANLQPLLIAGNLDPATSRIKGGQLMYTSDIENFPGAIENPEADVSEVRGVSGPDLMYRMELQARHFGAEMIEDFVTEVDICSNPGEIYTVTIESGQVYRTRALIIATGASAKRLGIEAENRFFGQGGGVSTCATCDGANFARLGASVAVIGGGDSAMEEAGYLARLEGIPKVYLIHRRDEFRASKIMLQRAQQNPKIEILTWKKVVDLKGGPHPLAAQIPFYADKEVLKAAVLEDTRTGEQSELPIQGLFVAIGHTPNTSLFTDQLKMDESGYLERDQHLRALPSAHACNRKLQGMDNVPGVFVAGDVSDHYYRQAITAAGMGCMAAIEAERYLAEKLAEEKHVDPDAVDLTPQSFAQSHWSSERDEGEKPMLERVEEAAEHEGENPSDTGANGPGDSREDGRTPGQ